MPSQIVCEMARVTIARLMFMKARLEICFNTSVLQGSDYMFVLDNFVKFIPSRITSKYTTKEWNENRDRKKLLTDKNETRFFLSDDQQNYLSIDNAGSKPSFKSVAVNHDSSIFIPSVELIEHFIGRNGFVSAYLLNGDFEAVQSEIFSNNLKGKSFSKEILDSIRNTPSKVDMWGGKEYDIKFNPGRSILIPYTWLMVGWKMWFGENFFRIVPKEKILSFPHAVEIKELESGIVYVQLFEDINMPYAPESIFRQWKWREWLDYDSLESQYS